MNGLYNILDLSIFVTSGLMLICGLMFLFIAVPDSPLLGNYRKARYMMACAYIFLGFGKLAEVFAASEHSPSDFNASLTLAIAISQALLFTFAPLALLNVRLAVWRRIFREAVCGLLFIAAVIASYALFSSETFRNVFYVLIAVYALFLVHYTLLFLKSYRQFKLRMDNYFSDMEAGRLRWVAFSFFGALAVGITALLTSLFMSALVALLFTIEFGLFYIFFAIRFINYAHHFQFIERAMDDNAPELVETPHLEVSATDSKITGMHEDALVQLEKRIKKWMADKGFTEPGITIDTLSNRLGTNSKYLSTYINACKKQTFREWINALRIEEAKRLLLERPEMTVHEIALHVGVATESHFGKQFRTCIGISPSHYRRQNTSAS